MLTIRKCIVPKANKPFRKIPAQMHSIEDSKNSNTISIPPSKTYTINSSTNYQKSNPIMNINNSPYTYKNYKTTLTMCTNECPKYSTTMRTSKTDSPSSKKCQVHPNQSF